MGGTAAVRRQVAVWFWLILLAVGACGSESTGPDPAVAPFVGDWDATELVVTSVASPVITADLIKLGAAFKLNVQPSGQYTAILVYAQQASTEIGRLSVSGNTVTLQRDFPTPSTSTAVYAFVGDNVLTLDGDSEFDFNLDGTPEPARARFRLVRR